MALAVVLPATAVQADDWTGFYAGASGGYSFSSVTTGAVENDSKKKTPFADIAAGYGNADPEGFEASVFIGYRMQSGGLVYGVEGGIATGNVEGTAEADAPNTATVTFGESYYLRGMVGTEYQGALVYGSLGLVSTHVTTQDSGFMRPAEGDMTGLTLGVGYERMLNDNWGIRAEINHTIYEDDYIIQLLPPGAELTRADFSSTSVQMGLTYRF